ncbi:MAG: hypothetical protein PT965_00710, partial [Clostridia bacterium]|nr:hypothetical protein [Clostridia bacterium]
LVGTYSLYGGTIASQFGGIILTNISSRICDKENDHAGAFLLLHGRYSVLAHYLKVSLKNSRFLKIPKLHPQRGRRFFVLFRGKAGERGRFSAPIIFFGTGTASFSPLILAGNPK